MLKFLRATKKAGLPPGTLVHVGEKKIDKVRIRVIDYDENNLDERELEKCCDLLNSRFGDWKNLSFQEKQKPLRFLQSRGFRLETIRALLL